MDLWYFFGCIGIDLLKENGIETYIAPNNWITNSGASIFRNKVLKETQILNFVDFSDHKIFETAEIQTMIYILLKNNNLKQYKTKYYRLNCNTSINNVRLNEFLNFETNTNNDFKYLVVIDRELFINGYIEFITIDKTNIANKILLKEHINLLGNEIGQGIVGAPDECFIIKDINRFNNAEKKYIKPYFTNVDRYFYRKAEEEYIIYLSNKNFEEKNLKNYPNLYNHFLKYRKILTEAKEKYGTPNKPYYYLHREREEKFFKKGIEKIISVGRTFYPKFYYTKDEFYGSRALFFIETKRINMKYLTAFLNSKLTFFWLYNKGKKQGEQLKVDKEPLMNIPVYKPTEQQEHNIVNIVDKILSLTTQKNYLSNKQSQEQVKKYQQEIDKKIYKFYDLTQEEIDIIEKNL